jgi:hypothetical protein
VGVGGGLFVAALVVVVVLCVALGGVLVVLVRVTARLNALVTELERESLPVLREAHAVAAHATDELERVVDVLGAARAVTETVDSASRLAYRVLAVPPVKLVAFGSGLRAAGRRLMGRGREARVRARRVEARRGLDRVQAGDTLPASRLDGAGGP